MARALRPACLPYCPDRSGNQGTEKKRCTTGERGKRAQTVFLEPEDSLYFIEPLKDTAEMWNIRVAAYCFMNNHYHLLV